MEKIDRYSANEWFILMETACGVCQVFSVPEIKDVWVQVEGPFKSKNEAEAKIKDACVEFQNCFYLKDEEKTKNLREIQKQLRTSHRADLAVCQSHSGERISLSLIHTPSPRDQRGSRMPSSA